MIPGAGAVDLVHGAKRVIVVMDHSARDFSAKLRKTCDLSVSGRGVVHRVITDLAVLDVEAGAFHLGELAPGVDLATVVARTDAPVVDGTASR